MSAPRLPVLVYDGDCAFCSASVRFGRRWIRRMPTVVPAQAADLVALGLTADQCAEAVQYVALDRRVHSAEDAVIAVLLAAGRGWWVLGALLRVPGVHWTAGVVYRWVARNRHRLPGGTDQCTMG